MFGIEYKKPDQIRLVVKGKTGIPVDICQGVQIERTNLQTAWHEEADVNIVKHLSESITFETKHITITLLSLFFYYIIMWNII